MTVHIFLGPTLAKQDALSIVPSAVVHPPVAHGDLLSLPLAGGDVVVIVDGYYHQRASVRHKEILALLARGVAVIGCASMGALRAAEMAEYGMIGSGEVYRLYRDGILDADDEVAIAHGPAPDYRSFTVPLVVVRHVVGMAVRMGVLDESEAKAIIDAACRVHYSERSWGAVRQVAGSTGSTAIALARLLKFVESAPDSTDIKVIDARDVLHRIANGELPGDPRPAQPWVSGDWSNKYLGEWEARFSHSGIDDTGVGDDLVVVHQQLYLDDFPARWQRFALRGIVDATGSDGDLAARALAKAAGNGLAAASPVSARLRYWLTSAEAAELAPDDALLRVLVRSYRPLRPTRDLVDDQPDLVQDDTARRAVAEAFVVNAEVATWGGKNTIDHLRRGTLLAHLAQVWRIDVPDPAALLAAARDRGFESIDAAAGAARLFFLHKSFLARTSS